MNFVGGDEAWSYIEREKVSVCEIVGNLKRHMIITDKDSISLYWLFPEKDLVNGLRPLNDDKECSYMLKCITNDGVADVYAEVVHENSEEEDESDSEYQLEEEEESESEGDDHVVSVPIAIYSDSEHENSEEDEEAKQYKRHANMVKKGIKGREDICEALVQAGHQVPHVHVDEELDSDAGDDTPYFDSSEEASYDDEEGLEISGCRRKSKFPRFDETAQLPIFSVGMTFRGREEFKQGVVNYGLAMKRHIAFPKDEKRRIRAKCSWAGCPWMIYGSYSSKCDWFQVQTYIPQHRCPQRRDNKLVTARRIADKYESLIKANPSWKLQDPKETVLLDMGADVTLSKIKRAKYTVMKRIYDAAKEEYPKLFDYQLEILRSNPGSTVAISLDPEIKIKHVFQKILSSAKN
ncbi:unnamed protein product [Urochloa decumbens]|uniref:Transposase MuDR plant domain-containing protein n=1 Tax=Urochloa decumbens TaxID=240449 RepID=A0ABC9B4Q7_9POAL